MTYIIAEIGGNHDGNLDQALELIEQVAETGADAIKFQTYCAEKLVHPEANALPQAKGYKRQLDRFRDLQFTESQWGDIIAACKTRRIDFLTTCFDVASLHRFAPYMKFVKVASGDLTYYRLLREIAQTGKPVILSTGMASYQEIKDAAWHFNPDILTVLHCVSIYPTPDPLANLNVIRELQKDYSSVGYSDHTQGISACIAAAGLGCTVIEKHVTLDNTRAYGDHPLSITPDELAELCSHVSRIEMMLGSDKPCIEEAENRKKMRRGPYARHPIAAGQVVTEKDIIELRPRLQRDPHEVIGRRARKDFEELDPIA